MRLNSPSTYSTSFYHQTHKLRKSSKICLRWTTTFCRVSGSATLTQMGIQTSSSPSDTRTAPLSHRSFLIVRCHTVRTLHLVSLTWISKRSTRRRKSRKTNRWRTDSSASTLQTPITMPSFTSIRMLVTPSLPTWLRTQCLIFWSSATIQEAMVNMPKTRQEKAGPSRYHRFPPFTIIWTEIPSISRLECSLTRSSALLSRQLPSDAYLPHCWTINSWYKAASQDSQPTELYRYQTSWLESAEVITSSKCSP